jgi:hypothetical protein
MSGIDNYVDVAERLKILKDLYPQASLQPANIAEPFKIVQIENITYIVYTAACYREPNDPRPGIGIAWERVPGKGMTIGSELAIAETSAWGRAIVAAIQTSTKRIATKQDVITAQHRQTAWSVTPNTEAILEEFRKPETWPQESIEAKVLEAAGRVKSVATKTEIIEGIKPMTVLEVANAFNAQSIDDAPLCDHGLMTYISGISKKTDREYRGYKCPNNEKGCEAKFMRQTPSGWVKNW